VVRNGTGARRQRRFRVGQGTCAAAADFDDQLGRALDAARAELEIDAALEAIAGVTQEAQPAHLALYDRRIPERAFQVDARRVAGDARMLAAHDAGEAQRLRAVADEQQVRFERERLPVQQRQRLAVTREADDDVALEQPVVVRVQRLAQLEHHVVGDVDDGRDGAHPRALDALLHPRRRRRARVDAFDDARGEPRARFGVLDSHAARRRAGHRRSAMRRQGERCVRDRGNFACDADDRQAVGTVRRELDRDLGIVERKRCSHVLSGDRIGRQLDEPGRVVRQPELARRAQHALRLDAAHRRTANRLAAGQHRPFHRAGDAHARCRIRGSAHDLQRRARTCIDGADAQAIGIGMLRNRGDRRHDDAGERRRAGRHVFDFEARHRELVAERRRVDRRVDQRAQPAFGEFHGIT
jgi:hypothetical protein